MGAGKCLLDEMTVFFLSTGGGSRRGVAAPQPLTLNLYDTEFYSKFDGSLDFGRTSSCFQIVQEDNVVDLKSTEKLLNSTSKPELKELLAKYDIVSVEVSRKYNLSSPTGFFFS